jgi:hypothetical protein
MWVFSFLVRFGLYLLLVWPTCLLNTIHDAAKVCSKGVVGLVKRTASIPPNLAVSSLALLGQFRRVLLVCAFAETFFRSPRPVNLSSSRPSIKGQLLAAINSMFHWY